VIRPKGKRWPSLSRAKLEKRDGAHCVHCGATAGLTIQHRAVKGAGGRNSAEAPSNGLLLCWWANWAAEALAEFAELARTYGWKLSTADVATDVPFYDAFLGVWKQPDDAWNAPTVG
jgi:hypothetical protein